MRKALILLSLVVSLGLLMKWLIPDQPPSPRGKEASAALRASPSAAPRASEPARRRSTRAVTQEATGAVPDQRLVSGWVVDTDGEPVAGALVQLDRRDEVESGPDGAFAFEGVSEGQHWLSASSGGRVAGPQVVLADWGEHETALTLRAAPSLEVRVGDAETGQAIAGARVEIRASSTPSAVTDARGRARFSGLEVGLHAVIASADGYAPARDIISVPGTDAGRLERGIELERGLALSGTVLDAASRPVPGAEVSAERVGELGAVDAAMQRSRSDSAGRFMLRVAAHAQYRLSARHPAHASTSLVPVEVAETPIANLLVRMPEAARLAGVVTAVDGAPIAGARVVVAAWGGGYSNATRRETLADERGLFEIGGLPRSWVNLVASSEQASSQTLSLDLGAQPELRGLRVVLEQTGRITGRVVDGRSAPVPGARVLADRKGASSAEPDGHTLSVLTDRHGAFALSGLSGAYRYRLQVVPGGVIQAKIHESRAWAEASVGQDVSLVMLEDGAIRGSVVFEDGRAPPEFTVSAGQGLPATFTGSAGVFALDRVPPGSTTLRIAGPSFVARILSDVEVEAELATNLGTIVVEQGAKLAGRVVTADDQPVANATVLVSSKLIGDGNTLGAAEMRGDHSIRSAESAADGSFVIAGLTPDQRLVVAAEHEELGKSQLVTLASATGARELKLVLEQPGRAAGVVSVLGAPSEGVMVSLARADARGSAIAALAVTTGPAGDYAFPSVPAGSYSLFAVRRIGESDIETKRVEVAIQPGRETRADFDLTRGVSSLIVSVPQETDEGAGPALYTAVLQGETARVRDLTSAEPAEFNDLEEGQYQLCVYRLSSRGPHQEPARGTPSCQPIQVTRGAAAQRVTIQPNIG